MHEKGVPSRAPCAYKNFKLDRSLFQSPLDSKEAKERLPNVYQKLTSLGLFDEPGEVAARPKSSLIIEDMTGRTGMMSLT